MREFLKDTFAYLQPHAILADLSGEDAARRLEKAPHSIAEIVGHMAFWQDWFLARCRGEAAPMVASAREGWFDVGAGAWDHERQRFLAGLDAAADLSQGSDGLNRTLTPAIEFPPLARYTVRDALTHVSVHNAHHLGQIVTLRQLLGKWPPPSGSWTW